MRERRIKRKARKKGIGGSTEVEDVREKVYDAVFYFFLLAGSSIPFVTSAFDRASVL